MPASAKSSLPIRVRDPRQGRLRDLRQPREPTCTAAASHGMHAMQSRSPRPRPRPYPPLQTLLVCQDQKVQKRPLQRSKTGPGPGPARLSTWNADKTVAYSRVLCRRWAGRSGPARPGRLLANCLFSTRRGMLVCRPALARERENLSRRPAGGSVRESNPAGWGAVLARKPARCSLMMDGIATEETRTDGTRAIGSQWRV